MRKPATFKASLMAMVLLIWTALDSAVARDLRITWVPSSDPNVTGYVIYYGTASQTYTSRVVVGAVSGTSLSGFVAGRTYYFSTASLDASGNESPKAAEVTYLICPRISGLSEINLLPSSSNQRVSFSLEAADAEPDWVLSATCEDPSLIPQGNISFSGTASSRTLIITPAAGAVGSTTLTVSITDGTSSHFVTVPVTIADNSVNTPPTLDTIDDLTLAEDDGTQTVPLTGISAGGSDSGQTLVVSATSNNPGLIPNPSVTYTSPNSTGTLRFAPVPNAWGTATITVSVNDRQAENNLITRTFAVTVTAVNDAPTLNSLADLSLLENSGPQSVSLTGITGGAGEGAQAVTITAQSSNPAIIPHPQVDYSSPATTGSLVFEPVANMAGNVTISVTVNDGQSANNLLTRTFNVGLTAVNHAPVVNIGTNTSTQPNVTFMVRARITDDGLPANPGRVTARWTKVSGPGPVTIGNSNSALTTMRFTAQGLYRMRLTGFDGELSSSNDFVVFVRANTDFKPPVFSEVKVSDITESAITLDWSTDEESTEQIEYTVQGGAALNTLLNQSLSLHHTVTLTNLQPGTTYTLRARSRDSSGNLSYSDPITTRTLRSAGIYIPLWPKHASSIVLPAESALDRYDRPNVWFPQDNAGSASFSFFAPVRGDYHIWARLYAPSAQNDKINLSIDQESPSPFELAIDSANTWSPNWQWVELRTYTLEPGTHGLLLQAVEKRVGVSQLLITNQRDLQPSDDLTLHGNLTVLQQDQPSYLMSVRSGWSMVANPLEAANSRIDSLLPNPPSGTMLLKFDPIAEGYLTNRFTEAGWSTPGMTLATGEGGLLFNPGVAFGWSIVGSVPSATPLSLHTGLNLISPTPGRAGSAANVMGGFDFHAGDTAHRLDSDTGAFTVSTFDGLSWDIEPVINLGESFFLTLQP